MLQHGRKSAEAASFLQIVPQERPKPPPDLTEEQAREWTIIVNRMPADWFTPETHCLLEALVCHICLARMIAAELKATKAKTEFDRFERLAKMHFMQSHAMANLATKMRLTQRSMYGQRKTWRMKRREPKIRPWEIE